jgi:hypothetical protein
MESMVALVGGEAKLVAEESMTATKDVTLSETAFRE